MLRTDVKMITAETWEEYKDTHDIRLRNEILMAYIQIVTFNARKLSAVYSGFMQTGDVVNQGVITLIDCIERYDPSRGIQFDTFASIRVRGSIIDYIRKQDWLPRRVRKRSKEIGDAYTELQNKMGRLPSDAEVAEYLGIDVEELNKTLGEVHSATVLYFEDMLQDNISESNEEPEKSLTPEQEYQKTELKEQLAMCIDRLEEKERMVISLYYFDDLKLKEIALLMGITASRVSQLHSRALLKLQSMIGSYVQE